MAASHQLVAPDVDRISQIVRNFKATQVIKTTNKRMVMWCPDLHCSKQLALRITQAGYQYEIKQGLNTPSWYVQAFY